MTSMTAQQVTMAHARAARRPKCQAGVYHKPLLGCGLLCHGGGLWAPCQHIALCWPMRRRLTRPPALL